MFEKSIHRHAGRIAGAKIAISFESAIGSSVFFKKDYKKAFPRGGEGDIESKRRFFKHEASLCAERCLYVYLLVYCINGLRV